MCDFKQGSSSAKTIFTFNVYFINVIFKRQYCKTLLNIFFAASRNVSFTQQRCVCIPRKRYESSIHMFFLSRTRSEIVRNIFYFSANFPCNVIYVVVMATVPISGCIFRSRKMDGGTFFEKKGLHLQSRS
ncbi:hypothetical protein PUN28_010527 [Cardiocondyla obscurior]|uniref:Uncharacterized protein n=1 Tax=Cardiocondyla obscurior TaxID=286306 RepID=A0AAW2FLI7_9HYME